MKPAAFEYYRVESIRDACRWLSEDSENSRILAGGQSLITVLNMRLAQPKRLLDISACEELNYLNDNGTHLTVGASVTQSTLQSWTLLAEKQPLLHEAIPFISHFQIRNRGTVAGSIAHADPSAELPLCLATLGGEVVLQSQKGKRVLSADAFLLGMLTTAKRPDELVTEVRFPHKKPNHAYAFDEFSMRRGDFAIVACAVEMSSTHLRLGVGGVADRPTVVEWSVDSDQLLKEQLNDLAWTLEAQDDQHASAAYRRHLVRHLGWNVIQTARQRLAKED